MMNKFIRLISFTLCLLLFAAFAKSAGETIDWQVIASGSTDQAEGSTTLSGTVGQAFIGLTANTDNSVQQGFWQDFGSGDPGFICGDANRDLSVNVSDAVFIINFVFVGGSPPDPYESGNVNCDSSVNVSDAVYIINYVFVGGSAPCDC